MQTIPLLAHFPFPLGANVDINTHPAARPMVRGLM
jgi:hypothetical protein